MMIHTQGKKFKKHSKIRVISNSSFHPIPRKVCFSSYRQLPKSCGDNYTCDVQYGSCLPHVQSEMCYKNNTHHILKTRKKAYKISYK